jgi:hypothetical protein
MGRHYWDRDGTPDHPVVRLYPYIPWYNKGAVWVRDEGGERDLEDILLEKAIP